MIRLGLKQEPEWLDLLPGVRIKVRPFTTALFFAAQTAMAKAPAADEVEAELVDAIRGLAFIKALARLAIFEWEGVGDAKGDEAMVEPEAIDALMDIWQAAAAFERLYARPLSEMDAEKNV